MYTSKVSYNTSGNKAHTDDTIKLEDKKTDNYKNRFYFCLCYALVAGPPNGPVLFCSLSFVVDVFRRL